MKFDEDYIVSLIIDIVIVIGWIGLIAGSIYITVAVLKFFFSAI